MYFCLKISSFAAVVDGVCRAYFCSGSGSDSGSCYEIERCHGRSRDMASERACAWELLRVSIRLCIFDACQARVLENSPVIARVAHMLAEVYTGDHSRTDDKRRAEVLRPSLAGKRCCATAALDGICRRAMVFAVEEAGSAAEEGRRRLYRAEASRLWDMEGYCLVAVAAWAAEVAETVLMLVHKQAVKGRALRCCSSQRRPWESVCSWVEMRSRWYFHCLSQSAEDAQAVCSVDAGRNDDRCVRVG